MVTDIDVLPARPRPLVECGLPPTLMVTRINIVGRARGPTSTGRGRIVFNLHIGYYRDPVTGRLCVVMSDSNRCLTPACVRLGCFPTLKEVFDAIKDAIKKVFDVLGIVLVAIRVILIIIALRGARALPQPGEFGPAPGPVFAGGGPAPAEAGPTPGEEPMAEEATV